MTSSSNFSRDRDALHICFTLSGGGILRQTLRNAGLSPVVITLSDDLSVGPIDPPDARLRKLWYERELDGEFPGWVEEEAREFWSIASEDWKRRVVWFSRRSAAEYCGFLGWLERIGSTSFDLLDVTNELHEVSTRGGRKSVVLESIAMVNPEQLDLKRLLPKARPLSAEGRSNYRTIWTKLKKENSAYRIASDFALKSVPIDYFDDVIRSCVTREWQAAIRIMGSVILMEKDGYLNVNWAAIFGRIRALAATGELEMRGETSEPNLCEVRLKRV